MIQRHLLTHVYNPSQFFRGRAPLVSSSPYIAYAQMSSGAPGSRKRSSSTVLDIFHQTAFGPCFQPVPMECQACRYVDTFDRSIHVYFAYVYQGATGSRPELWHAWQSRSSGILNDPWKAVV